MTLLRPTVHVLSPIVHTGCICPYLRPLPTMPALELIQTYIKIQIFCTYDGPNGEHRHMRNLLGNVLFYYHGE
jgi:hypothetical protein